MKTMVFEIVIEREDDPQEIYSVHCPALPGCYSCGSSPEEAKRNMTEAIVLHLEGLAANGEPWPTPGKRVKVEELEIAVPA